jgi:hypothetical protein
MLQQNLRCLGRIRLLHTLPFAPDKRWPEWQVIIGIETHAQIKSRRKLFSSKNPRGSFHLFSNEWTSWNRFIDFRLK